MSSGLKRKHTFWCEGCHKFIPKWLIVEHKKNCHNVYKRTK